MSRSITPVALVLCLIAAPRSALAGDIAAAQALFDEAKQLAAQGHYDQACPKLQESQRLDPGMGTLFHLADCLQHTGRNASAWALFRDVESQAHASGQQGRERVARDRAAALEPFLSRIIVAPKDYSENPQVEVRRDGVVVGRGEWNVPLPVDPGTHVIAVLAANKRPWETNVEVPADGRVVTVDLPALADLPDVSPAGRAGVPPRKPLPPVRPQGGRGVTQAMPPSEEEAVLQNRGAAQRALGWFFVGGGAVGLGAGAYYGLKWLDDHQQSLNHCRGGPCDSIGIASRNLARKEAHDAEAAGGIGAAAIVIGLVLVLSAPSPRVVANNTAKIEVAPAAGPAGGGISVHGTW
jgi:serine/threonine-protein kinase